MSKYETIIKRVFENEAESNGVARELTFTRDDLEHAIEEVGVERVCVPDIPYAYRSRRSLPEGIAGHGFKRIEVAENQKGQEIVYKFAR